MKFKLFTLLLVCTLFVGCGQNTNNSINNTNLKEEAILDEKEEATQDESEQTTSENSADQEPYILNFEASTIEGTPLTSDIFADSKLTMINVWATYCNPCLSEMPDLGELATSKDAADFQLIGIISDVMEGAKEEELQNAKSLIEETQANYPHLLLNESLYSNLVGAVDSVPTTFFVNQKGELLGYVVGARAKEDWEAIINELQAEME